MHKSVDCTPPSTSQNILAQYLAYCQVLLILVMAVGGRPKPELCFLPWRLR